MGDWRGRGSSTSKPIRRVIPANSDVSRNPLEHHELSSPRERGQARQHLHPQRPGGPIQALQGLKGGEGVREDCYRSSAFTVMAIDMAISSARKEGPLSRVNAYCALVEGTYTLPQHLPPQPNHLCKDRSGQGRWTSITGERPPSRMLDCPFYWCHSQSQCRWRVPGAIP